MTNIVNFPKAPKAKITYRPAVKIDAEKIKAAMPKSVTVKNVFTFILWAIRMPLFLVMYWLRLPVVFVCNIISVPALFAWLFAWYAFPEKTGMVWGIAALSFTAFFIRYAYDFILSVLSPQTMMMEL